MNKTLVIFLLCLFQINGIIAQFNISGKILNEDGESIEFASVFLVGENYAAISSADGMYFIEDVRPGIYTLKTTFLGYRPLEKDIEIINEDLVLDLTLKGQMYQLDQVEILSNRVTEKDAFTYTELENEYLEEENNGQDLPYALRLTPSVVVTSDAGAGIGYTGIRIRGSDATRINVTINGVPLNDAESQGVFWVDLPDFISSTENIQIQRGVGTSTNGVGAFGGSVSLNTLKTHINPYASLDLGAGSYATRRMSFKVGTGLINDHYSIDARYSLIKSDGYIDRASSDLKSLYFSASRIDENKSLRFLVFSGHEVTYQSWYGSPQSRVDGNLESLTNHYYTNIGSLYFTSQDSINLFASGRRYNYYQYDNQVDDYRQTHVQLHSHNKVGENWLVNGSLFYTMGKGFFEEYKVGQDLAEYEIDNGDFSDLVRRRWLDNDYFGLSLNATHELNENADISLGFHASRYVGGHFGKVVDILSGVNFDRRNSYYFNEGNKGEESFYLKSRMKLSEKISIMGDVQLRNLGYTIQGDDNDDRILDVDEDFLFLNPKIGVHSQWNNNHQSYASYAYANKEPNRSDFKDNDQLSSPEAELLRDFEIGHRYITGKWSSEVVIYNMQYKNQLVLTGALNDAGSPLRTNVEKSSRMGIEMMVTTNITEKIQFSGNATFSRNRIKEFKEILYDYTLGFDIKDISHENTNISFSPGNIMGAGLKYMLTPWMNIDYRFKYVGKQYLDNTSSEDRKLNSYGVHDMRLDVSPDFEMLKKVKFSFEVRNLWNSLYSSNGYTYSYIYGDLITENFLYPQAERNFMVNLSIEL